MTLTRYIRFGLFVLRNGRYMTQHIDFERQRRVLLNDVPTYNLPDRYRSSPSFYVRVRNALLKQNYLFPIINGVATLKNKKRVHRQLFVSDKDALVYIRLFKNASTSILRTMLPRIYAELNTDELQDEQIDALAHYVQRRHAPPHYQRFAVVRNPFARLVSAYRDVFNPRDELFSYSDFHFGIFRKDMDFKTFVNTLAQVPDELRGPHFSSQHYALACSCPLPSIRVFRLEEDQIKLKSFLETYQLTIGRHNTSEQEYNFAGYYDDDTAKLVYEMYELDFITFEYANAYANLKNEISNQKFR